MTALRLITWNVNRRVGHLDEQVAALRDQQPGIVALQEVTATTAPRLREGLIRAGLPYVLDTYQTHTHATRGGGRNYGELIASRWPLHPLTEPRIAIPWQQCVLSAVIDSEWGEIELHTAHVPPGSSNGRTKIDTLNGIYKRLASATDRHRVLCGDFNTPQAERLDRQVVTWGQTINADDTVEVWGRWRGVTGKAWDQAERNILIGLANFDLQDCFRALNGYKEEAYSWYWTGRSQQVRRRFDHVFASSRLNATSASYLPEWRKQGLSDHAPLEVVFAPEIVVAPRSGIESQLQSQQP